MQHVAWTMKTAEKATSGHYHRHFYGQKQLFYNSTDVFGLHFYRFMLFPLLSIIYQMNNKTFSELVFYSAFVQKIYQRPRNHIIMTSIDCQLTCTYDVNQWSGSFERFSDCTWCRMSVDIYNPNSKRRPVIPSLKKVLYFR